MRYIYPLCLIAVMGACLNVACADDSLLPVSGAAPYVNADALVAGTNGARITFVDIRTRECFEKSHIPGSVCLPAFAIPRKKYLADNRVVLVDDGLFSSQTEALCSELIKAGWSDVSILAGGLYAWKGAGGRLTGDYPLVRGIRLLSAAQALELMKSGKVVLIDMSSQPSDELLAAVQDSGVRCVRTTSKTILNDSTTRNEWRTNYDGVLVLNDSGNIPSPDLASIQKDNLLYVVADGEPSLAQEVRRHRILAMNRISSKTYRISNNEVQSRQRSSFRTSAGCSTCGK